MKKTAFFLFVLILALAFTGCAKKPGDTTSTTENENSKAQTSQSDETSKTEQPGTLTPNPVELIFHPATSPDAGAYATIKISADIKFDDSTAWLGLCPAGKDYITEAEADEVDVIWFNEEGKEDETDPHVFACDFSEVEDGTYALVVATSDDENVGFVIIQLEMTKKGESLTFNYANAKIKERPAK